MKNLIQIGETIHFNIILVGGTDTIGHTTNSTAYMQTILPLIYHYPTHFPPYMIWANQTSRQGLLIDLERGVGSGIDRGYGLAGDAGLQDTRRNWRSTQSHNSLRIDI